MEARFARVSPAVTLFACWCLLAVGLPATHAAGYKTANFTVNAPTPELAKEIGDTAESSRKQLAVEWLGEEMPSWAHPCPITARVAPSLGAGGATSFVFDHGQVFDWNMNIQGSRERVLDSVLPHEITHTIFASHFRQPLPRWADEGACTTVEHRSEVAKQERMLIDFLKTGRGIPFSQMFAMTEYPKDVMPLYSQGHSLSQWLIESRGRTEFLTFLSDGMADDNWPRAVEKHYGFTNLSTMQDTWLEWVKSGRPHLSPETSLITQNLARTRGGVTTASATNVSNTTASGAKGAPAAVAIFRGQSPDDITPIAAERSERATPAAHASVPSSTTVAAGGSVYAAAATTTERAHVAEPDLPPPAAAPATLPGPSVYDASRGAAIIRR